jgi:DNA-binding response OmpR family regulator
VILASDGEAATALLREGDARFDGLISDIDLPGKVQGWQIAALARRTHGCLPVIYVTGQAGADFLSMGVPDSILLPKPFEWSRLLTSLSGLIRVARLTEAGGPAGPSTAQ